MKKHKTGRRHQPVRTVNARKDFPIVMIGLIAFGLLFLFGLWANRENLAGMFTESEPVQTNAVQSATLPEEAASGGP
jgi:FtsZ-interacting cell division protein ZipA